MLNLDSFLDEFSKNQDKKRKQQELEHKKKEQERKVLASQKKKEEEVHRNRPFKDKAIDAVMKGLEIIDRPGDAVRTGIKEKAEGDSFWKGAKDGFTGKKNTSGKEVNKALGFDPDKNDVVKSVAKFLGKGFVATSPTGGLYTPVVNDDIAKKVGTETAGVVTEMATDPLNLVGVGIAAKAKNLLKSGRTVQQVAQELNVPVEVVQREFVRGMNPGQEIVDPNALRLEAPKEDPLRFLTGPTEKPKEVLGLNEPLYNRSVEGLGKEVNINGTPQLNAPRFDQAVQPSEIPDIENNLQDIFKRRQTEEDSFVRSEMAPYDDMLKRSSEADMVWNDSVKKSKEMADNIKKNYGKISVPEGNWADWGHEVPVQFRAKRGDNSSGIDLYTFADNEGFSSVDEAVQFLKQLDAESKTKLKDLKPVDDMKITPDDYAGLENIARQKFQETETAKGIDSYFNELNEMRRSVDETSATADPLSFMQSKLFKVNKEPVSFTGRMDPKDMSAVRSEGSYSTRYKETPTGDTLEIHPEKPLEFKTQTEARPFKTQVQTERVRKDVTEVNSSKPNAQDAQPTRQSFVGVENQKPLGAVFGGTVDSYQGTGIAGSEGFIDKVKSGEVSLKKTVQNLKTQISSDTQPFYDAEIEISKANPQLDTISDGSLKTSDSLHKGLRGVKRATSMAQKSIDKTYKPMLRSLEKAGISRVEFDTYVAHVHAKDIMDENAAKLASDPNAELYELPADMTPAKVNATLSKWAGNQDMQNAHAVFMREQRKDMQMLVDAGRFTQQEVDELFRKHPNYVSMARKHEAYEPSIRVGTSRDVGSDKPIMNPLDSAIRSRVISYHAASKNLALQRIEKLANLNEGNKFFLKELGPDATANELKNSIKFYKDGVEKRYEVPEYLMNAYEKLTVGQADDVMNKALAATNNIIRKGATGYNLDFIAKSILRDSQAPLLTSRTGLKPHDVVLGFMDSFMGDHLTKLTGGKFKSYREVYKDLGGESTGIISMDYNSINKMTSAMKKGTLGRGWELINPLKNIERLGTAVEHGAKLGEFRSAKRAGLSDEDAVFQAVDVFDYTDAGTVGRKMNKFVTFFNAAIRGNARVLEAAKQPQFWAKGAMYITAPTVGIYATRFAPGVSEEQRTRLRNMPDWKKNLAWHMPVPNSDKIISVPKGHLVAQIFANPVERVLDKVYDDANKSWGDVALDTGKDFLSVLMPPTGIAGISIIAGIISNYDWFMKMPIEDSNMQRDEKKDRHNMYTSEVAKNVSEGVSKVTGGIWTPSPAKTDYGIKGLTGGLGRDVLDTIDNHTAKGERPSKVNSTAQIWNPLDSFVDDKTQGSGVYDRLYKIKGTNKEAEGYYDALYDLNKIIKEVRESKKMTPQEKRQEIEDLRTQQKQIGDEVLKSGILKNK